MLSPVKTFLRPMTGEVSVRMAAPPSEVWDLVSDVTRIVECPRICFTCSIDAPSAIMNAAAVCRRSWNRSFPGSPAALTAGLKCRAMKLRCRSGPPSAEVNTIRSGDG